MINYKRGKCPRCGRLNKELMFSNNPLDGEPICFDCIKTILDPKNLNQADFFCRTYNLPFNPNAWIEFANAYGEDTFREYTSTVLENQEDQVNLYYTSSTRDLWAKTNIEWEKARHFADILNKITTIKDSYIERGHLKWGNQYEFEQLIKLDSMYSKTLKANNITNPIQKQAVQTLCKIQVEMDEAIQMKDSKAIKDFSSAFSTFAKQADLEGMINETKTDAILTVSELFDYAEQKGFEPEYYQGDVKDDIDMAIKDIQESNRRLILESSGIQTELQSMIDKRTKEKEEIYTEEVTSNEDLQSLLNYKLPSLEDQVEVEDDDSINSTYEDIEKDDYEEQKNPTKTVVKWKEK